MSSWKSSALTLFSVVKHSCMLRLSFYFVLQWQMICKWEHEKYISPVPTPTSAPINIVLLSREVIFTGGVRKQRPSVTAVHCCRNNEVNGKFVPWYDIGWASGNKIVPLYLDFLFKSLLWQSLLLAYQVWLPYISSFFSVIQEAFPGYSYLWKPELESSLGDVQCWFCSFRSLC